MREPQFQQLSSNGISLRAVVEGRGPLCVLVHGWPESWYSWRHQIAPLVAAGYRVCVPDVRGYGGSDKPYAVEAYAMVEMARDVVGLIDALGEEQAILIGHDWGAPIVWATSILHRPRVSAVVGMSVPHLGRGKASLIETFKQIYKDRFFYQLYFQEEGVAEAELEADVRTALRKIYYGSSGDAGDKQGMFVSKGPSATLLEGLIDPDPFPAWLSEADLDYYTQQFEHSGFRGPLNRYRNSERDFRDTPEFSTEHITQPALFIAGTLDPVLRFVPGIARLSDIMDRWFDDLRGKVLIEGAGHWIQQERVEETNRALVEFLKGL